MSTALRAGVGRYGPGGLTYRQFGAQLCISPKTVEHHVARIRRKVRTEAEGRGCRRPFGPDFALRRKPRFAGDSYGANHINPIRIEPQHRDKGAKKMAVDAQGAMHDLIMKILGRHDVAQSVAADTGAAVNAAGLGDVQATMTVADFQAQVAVVCDELSDVISAEVHAALSAYSAGNPARSTALANARRSERIRSSSKTGTSNAQRS